MASMTESLKTNAINLSAPYTLSLQRNLHWWSAPKRIPLVRGGAFVLISTFPGIHILFP